MIERRRAYVFVWPLSVLLALAALEWASRVNLSGSVLARSFAMLLGPPASFLLLVLPGIALLSLVAKWYSVGPAMGLALIFVGTGIAGMSEFWMWLQSPDLGKGGAIALVVVSTLALAICGSGRVLISTGLHWPLVLAALVALLFTGFAFIQGGIAVSPAHSVAVRYWLAPDGAIPLIFANHVAAHEPLGGFLFGNWQASDRPPLQTGMFLGQIPFAGNRDVAYQLLGTNAQVLWLPAAWIVLRSLGVDLRRTSIAVFAVTATGIMFFNTIYVWPKMLAGSMALAALGLLVSRHKRDHWPGALLLAGLLAALSMLSHGGTVFALLGLVPAGVVLAKRYRARWTVGALVAGLAVYVPWIGFQHLVDPPGNRLLKWQIGGVTAWNHRSVTATVIDHYRSVGWSGALANKVENVITLFARPSMWHVDTADPGWHTSYLGIARVAQMNELLCAVGPLLLGLLALALPHSRLRLRVLRPLVGFIVVTLGAWVLLLFGNTISTTVVHQGPYALVILLMVIAGVAVATLPKLLSIGILALSGAWFVIEWVPGFGFRPAELGSYSQTLDVAMLIVCIVALVAVVGTTWLMFKTQRTLAESAYGESILEVPIASPTHELTEIL